MEAKIRVEKVVQKWVVEAEGREFKAELAAAESLYSHALAYYPASKRANYRLGRFYYDNGRQRKGIAVLRQHGMLLDVPRFTVAPEIDGRLDDEVWTHAAQADTFYQLSFRHGAALISELKSRLYVGYNDNWYHEGLLQSGGASRDDEVRQWNADAEVAAHVGDDFWSVEYRLNFGQPQLEHPTSGTIWGFNLSRTYRNTEYAQWVRMSSAHAQNELGLLLFQ